jgi:dTDP-glucose 4,6-dehydratase|tara:strand:- start:477 stop:1481 length:1005 start_codon:yes stop_codon:yes gene_type:complete
MKSKKKVFLTGSEGFVGSHLLEYLVGLNYKVKALVQYNSFDNMGWLNTIDKKTLKSIEIVKGDIRDKEFLEKNITDCNIIIHLAALIGIPYSYEAARSYIDVNIIGTLNLLEIARKKKISKFIHTSTSEVYGTAQYIPMDENHPKVPQSPYAASKSAADQLAMSYYYSYNLPVTIIRPFNIFGPRQSMRAVIPTIINQAILNKDKIYLGTTNSKRDYTFVLDAVNAFEKCINNKDAIGKTINIGNNFEVSIAEIVKFTSSISEQKIKIISDKKRIRPKKSEVMRLRSSNGLSGKLLKWKPTYKGKSGFKKALKITFEWYKINQLKIFNSKKYII